MTPASHPGPGVNRDPPLAPGPGKGQGGLRATMGRATTESHPGACARGSWVPGLELNQPGRRRWGCGRHSPGEAAGPKGLDTGYGGLCGVRGVVGRQQGQRGDSLGLREGTGQSGAGCQGPWTLLLRKPRARLRALCPAEHMWLWADPTTRPASLQTAGQRARTQACWRWNTAEWTGGPRGGQAPGDKLGPSPPSPLLLRLRRREEARWTQTPRPVTRRLARAERCPPELACPG